MRRSAIQRSVTAALGTALAVHVAFAASDAALKVRLQTLTTPAQNLTVDLQRWSTDAERAPLLAALTVSAPGDGAGRGTAGRGGTTTPGAGPGTPAGRPAGPGRQSVATDSPQPTGQAAPAAPARGTGGRAAGGGRGARGGGRGAAATLTPTARLAAALKAAPTVGYVWGTGVTGYSIKYAWRSPATGAPNRLVLVTDRRIDAAASSSAGSADPAADFTVVEIRFDSKGSGQGKTSLTTNAVIDQAAQTIAVQSFDTLPQQLRITP